MLGLECCHSTPFVWLLLQQYLKYFMRGLEYEYRSSGVTFQCLCPVYVATRMTQYSATLSSPCLSIPSAATYARHALATLGWASETSGYWPHTVQVHLSALAGTTMMCWKYVVAAESSITLICKVIGAVWELMGLRGFDHVHVFNPRVIYLFVLGVRK